jgi:methionine biosynthesis protein MetW
MDITASDSDYSAYWSEKRGKSLGALSSWQKARADFMLSCLANEEGVSIVDIGCGDGSILNYIKKKTSVSKAIGIDVSSAALEKARSFGIETMQADINNPCFLDAVPVADYISLFEILEHIPDSEAMLKAAYGRVSRGIFFSFPNTGFFTHRFRLLLGRFPAQWRIRPNEHLRFWTLADLKWWLRAQGYFGWHIHCYKGMSVMNKIWPSLFAAAFIVYLPKNIS